MKTKLKSNKMKLSFATILFSKVDKLKNKSLTTLIRLELATKFNFPCMQQAYMGRNRLS